MAGIGLLTIPTVVYRRPAMSKAVPSQEWMDAAAGSHVEPATSGQAGQMPRRMGILSLVLTVLAYLSPLAGAVGFVPLVIGYGNGLGAPFMFLVAGAVLTIFAI